MKPYVKDGTIKTFVLWNPVDLGYLTVQVASRLAAKPLDTGATSFGRLNGIQVAGEEVILGPPLLFDKANIDQYDF